MVTTLLHPAERRRIEARIPPAADHEVVLRPLGSAVLDPTAVGPFRELIVTSTDPKFFPALVADLKRSDWRALLDVMRRRRVGDDGLLELNPPLHKRTQVALFEAVCRRPGAPRLDAKQITGSGLVVRRLSSGRRQAWIKVGGRVAGWQSASEAADYDPDPKQRRTSHKANAAIRQAIAERKGISDDAAEDVTQLFVLPPEVCEARGKTILFGVIPVVSSETAEGPGPSIDFGSLDATDRQEIVDHFSSYLKERASTPMPRAGAALDPKWNVLTDPRDDSGNPDPQMKAFGVFLHQALSELDLFGSSAASQRLAASFATIRLPLAKDGYGNVTQDTDAASFLRDAMRLLLDATPQTVGLAPGAPTASAQMPLEWPTIDSSTGSELTAAALDCLSSQHARLSPSQPRYDGDANRYQVKGFIRLKGHGECPERIVWSGYSEPFRIVPWWDGEGPGVKINLPSMDKLRQLKPNVSFAIPPKIGKVLSGDLSKVLDGEDPGGIELGWLCSFSIPIITLCAFIVLHIFLGLLNIVFWWMLWFKICIPIPKSKSGG
uniref:hypothetical protein n=1 Tax=Altererythrobacter segetis TaxID=1104773 RepID=UPI0014088EBA|nr:hypothetical protein [Altererythrobacter segetis]